MCEECGRLATHMLFFRPLCFRHYSELLPSQAHASLEDAAESIFIRIMNDVANYGEKAMVCDPED